MNLDLLEKVLEKQSSYRLKQAKLAVFGELVENWSEAKTLPLVLQKELNEKCPLDIKTENIQESKNTTKILLVLDDGLKIETVLMSHPDKNGGGRRRNTVCVSSQVGCSLGCKFCTTGKSGFKRNLTVWEIIEQVLFFARKLKDKNERVDNVVFMGMGEPFLNYENVMEAIRLLNSKDGMEIGARSISVSTSGIVEGIKKLAGENLQANLAISLHASNDELRSKLMPVNKKYPLKNVLKAVDEYLVKTNRKVMFEYIMIDGVNDSGEHANELAGLMKKKLYLVNLIPYNQTDVFNPSSPERIKQFREILEKDGISVTQRFRFGEKIKAACGQLAGED